MNIKIIAYMVGKEPTILEIDNSLKPMQDYVGGRVEVVYVTDELLLICNDEGKFNEECKPNRNLFNMDGRFRDSIDGDFFICRELGEDFASITDGDLAVAEQYLHQVRCPIEAEKAFKMLPETNMIHTFRKSLFGVIGCDIPIESIISKINQFGVELAGKEAKAMRHELVLKDENGWLFIETKEQEDKPKI